jgi:hypothetical protein
MKSNSHCREAEKDIINLPEARVGSGDVFKSIADRSVGTFQCSN